MKKILLIFLSTFLTVFVLIGNPCSVFALQTQAEHQTVQDAHDDASDLQDTTPEALDEIIDNEQNPEAAPEPTQVPSQETNTSEQTTESTQDSQTAADDESVVRISKVKIKGAEVVTNAQIEQVIGTEFPSIRFWVKKPVFDEEVLKDDMIRIQRLYANNGYYDAQANFETKFNDDGTRVEITIKIEEGDPVILTDVNVRFEGDLTEKVKKEILDAIPLKVDKTFSPNGYQQTKGVISEILSNNGYPKSEIEGEALVNRREKWARAKFVVKPGEIYKFGVI